MQTDSGPTKRLVFIAGASGSGTTMLLRILGGSRGAAALGGNHVALPATVLDGAPLMETITRFNDATAKLWDREATRDVSRRSLQAARSMLSNIAAAPELRDVSTLVYKRSYPFLEGDRFCPDLADLDAMTPDARFVLVTRDPRASALSSFRRGFDTSLRRCAAVCAERLTQLNDQVSVLDRDRWTEAPYEHFCARPHEFAPALAHIAGLQTEDVLESIRAESPRPVSAEGWRSKTSPDEANMLDEFFSPERRARWPLLTGASMPAVAA